MVHTYGYDDSEEVQDRDVPLISSTYCEYRPQYSKLVVASEVFGGSFPKAIDVESHRTGRIVRFVVDHRSALSAEFWDGEEMHYIPDQYQMPLDKAVSLVVIHQF